MVPQRIPKEVYVGREILEMSLYAAVAHFNIRTSAVLKLFNTLGIPSGKFTENGLREQDQAPVDLAQRKSQENRKKKEKKSTVNSRFADTSLLRTAAKSPA